MSEYFPEPKSLEGKVKVDLDLSNYATKADFKNATGVDTFAKKIDLANLKFNVDKLNIDKLKNVPSGLKSLKSKVDKLDFGKLGTAPVLLNEVKGPIPNTTNLATNTALMAVENKILNVSNLLKKTDYNTKINETEKKISDHDHDKYITTPEFNKLTVENFVARLAQANLSSKSDIANFVKKTDFDDKLKNLNKRVTSNKTKHLLIENESKNYKHLNSSLFLVEVILIMTKHNFTISFNQLTKLLEHFLVFQTQSQNGNLRDCQIKHFNLLKQKMKVFLQNRMV